MTKQKKDTVKCLDCGWEGSKYELLIGIRQISCPKCGSSNTEYANKHIYEFALNRHRLKDEEMKFREAWSFLTLGEKLVIAVPALGVSLVVISYLILFVLKLAAS